MNSHLAEFASAAREVIACGSAFEQRTVEMGHGQSPPTPRLKLKLHAVRSSRNLEQKYGTRSQHHFSTALNRNADNMRCSWQPRQRSCTDGQAHGQIPSESSRCHVLTTGHRMKSGLGVRQAEGANRECLPGQKLLILIQDGGEAGVSTWKIRGRKPFHTVLLRWKIKEHKYFRAKHLGNKNLFPL